MAAEAEKKTPPLRTLVTRFSAWNRRRKARRIRRFMDEHECRTVLMVGAMPLGATLANEGIVESAVRDGRNVVMGFNIEHPKQGAFDYPFMIADARSMPFEADYVDFALANAIIEHVGGEGDQRRFVNEHVRVARCWAITTPNRWFPVEPHTATLFRHWAPRWRAAQPPGVFTRLLSRREFAELLPRGTKIEGHWWSPTFLALYARD